MCNYEYTDAMKIKDSYSCKDLRAIDQAVFVMFGALSWLMQLIASAIIKLQ
jgi:hypothetical protein